MRKPGWVVTLVALAALCAPAAADTAMPEMRGTWEGDSHSVVVGGGLHHPDAKPGEPRFTTVPFTLVVDKQDGRRFSGTFSSPRSSEKVVAVLSRDGKIMMADDDGYTIGSILAPNKIELCYIKPGATRIASCTELTKQ